MVFHVVVAAQVRGLYLKMVLPVVVRAKVRVLCKLQVEVVDQVLYFGTGLLVAAVEQVLVLY